jgi:UDP-galactopyranose mutase
MPKRLTIVGAGLAGATAAAILESRHDVTVLDTASRPAGLCLDADGYQESGPHALHTDDAEVWEWLQRWADWRAYSLQVYTLTDPETLTELPRRHDQVFTIYSAKAWGRRWEDLPESIRARVPQLCADGRDGYHAGKYKAQPVGGYSAMIGRMLAGADLRLACAPDAWRTARSGTGDPMLWAAPLSAYMPGVRYVCRTWTHTPGRLPVPVVNYATHAVPQLRSYDNDRMGCQYDAIVSTEWPTLARGVPCYPCPYPADAARAAHALADMRGVGIIPVGRTGSYQYLDMDATIRNVFDTIREAGL